MEFLCKSSIDSENRSVFLPHHPHSILVKFCQDTIDSKIERPAFGAPASRDHICAIVALRSFNNMTGIETGRNVATMPAFRLGPSAMCEIERKSVHEHRTVSKLALAVSIYIPRKWPNETLVGIVVADRVKQKLVVSLAIVGSILIGHLRSFIARVLGEYAFTSGSPSLVYQKENLWTH
jgi:hypothetical protein